MIPENEAQRLRALKRDNYLAYLTELYEYASKEMGKYDDELEPLQHSHAVFAAREIKSQLEQERKKVHAARNRIMGPSRRNFNAREAALVGGDPTPY